MTDMATYARNDPALKAAIKAQAAKTAAEWPPLSEEQRARLSVLLAPPAAEAKPQRQPRQVPAPRQDAA